MERNRTLKTGSTEEIFSQNSWDNMVWDEVREEEAEKIISKQEMDSQHIGEVDAVELEVEGPACERWDRFYHNHERNFFKDRNWLESEFPELFDAQNSCSILEVGCGAGNTLFPISRIRGYLLKTVSDYPKFHLFGSDFSGKAINLCLEHPDYQPSTMTFFIHDLSKDDEFINPKTGLPIPPNSQDVIVAIFVLSALNPDRLPFVFEKLHRLLRKGGSLLFRDYAKYDMTQLRFKSNRLIRKNLYIRGDGTAVHFFAEDEMRSLAKDFTVEYLKIDRRLLVNRHRKLQMYRIWMQCKLTK